MPISDVLAALSALTTDEQKEFAAQVAKDTPAALKPLRSKFFAAGKADVTKEDGPLDTATKRVATLEAELATVREEAASASRGQPTPTEREADLQRKLTKAERDLEKVAAERETAKQEAVKVREESDTHALTSAMKGKLRPRYAELVAGSYRSRVVRKEDGSLELRDADGIPVDVPKGQTVWQAAAQMAVDEAEPVDRLAGGDSGGGVHNGSGIGGGVNLAKVQQARVEAAREVVQGAF